MALPIVELESVLWEELLLMVVLLVSEVIVVFFVFLHDCASIELSSKIEKMNDTTRDRFINF
jgi:preprotein translocase subunit SecG